MRRPEQINLESDLQCQAYYRSFLQSLDESRNDLNDWEAEFVESCLFRSEFSPKQLEVIRRPMDKFPRCYPKFEHYSTKAQAFEYLYL